jgi:hypothetical protein
MAKPRHEIVLAEEPDQFVEGGVVKRLLGFAGLDGRQPGRQGLPELGQLLGEILCER